MEDFEMHSETLRKQSSLSQNYDIRQKKDIEARRKVQQLVHYHVSIKTKSRDLSLFLDDSHYF